MKWFLPLLLLLVMVVPTRPQNTDREPIDRSTYPRLRWMGPEKPGTYADSMRMHFPTSVRVREHSLHTDPFPGKTPLKSSFAKNRPLVAVIANSAVYERMEEYVHAYAGIIGNLGYQARVFSFEGGSHRNVRALLTRLGKTLLGAVLIGPMPAAWYEIDDDYGDGEPAEFPCDLYYMDLDGNWIDSDRNGLFEDHKDGNGDRAPEIFIARIDTSMHGEDERYSLLQNYFIRDLRYWNGEISLVHSGLTYTEDDWKVYPDQTRSLSPLYQSAYDSIIAPRTNRDDYLVRLADPVYDIVQLSCHSSSHAHHFTRSGQLFYHQVQEAPPAAVFYNLFACSSARFTETNHLGGAYLYNDTSRALAVVGSTKTGSMLGFSNFYTPLAQNRSLGEAFLQWFQAMAPYDFWEVCWHYGMCLLGDPLVTLMSVPGGLRAPRNFTAVKLENQSMLIAEWMIRLSWDDPPEEGEEPAGFRLYRLDENRLNLLAELEPGAREYLLRRVDRDSTCTLALTTCAADCRESPPAFARVE